jgi:inosose dehydratase
MTGASRGIKAGCQTYTWEMLGNSWDGGPDDLLAAVADGGYAGIEITDTMIGHYADRPDAFAAALKDKGLALVAYSMASKSGFTRKRPRYGTPLDRFRRHVSRRAHIDGLRHRHVRWPSRRQIRDISRILQ